MPDAFHLPALPILPVDAREHGIGGAAAELRHPRLSPERLREQIEALREAHARHLAERPVAGIARAVDAVAGRLLDRSDPLRRSAEETLPALTGYSPEMVRRVLDRMAADWRLDRLDALLAAELGDPGVLDGFRPRPHAPGGTRAYGPGVTFHVFSGNVPGVAVTSLIRALLVKSASLGKTAAGEPLLPVLFARGLAEVDEGLGQCVAVAYWPGGDEHLEREVLGSVDAVVAYGGADAIRSLRKRTPPGTRFLEYGHRVSFAALAREALTRSEAPVLARHAALATALFDQQGCVSPHLFYAERGGEVSPEEWTQLLARALEQLETELPRGRIEAAEASAIQQLRGEAEFAELGGTGTVLYTPADGTAWTVVYDPDPTFHASCLNRLVRVKPLDDLEELAQRVRPLSGLLQTVGLAAPASRADALAGILGRLGASRITPIESMPWPPPSWHHDGRPALGDLLRWCDWE